jgi:hypothetical protein
VHIDKRFSAVEKCENFAVRKCDWYMSKKMPIFASKNK